MGDVFNEIYRNKSRRGDLAKGGKDGDGGSGSERDDGQVVTRRRKPAVAAESAPAPAPVAAPEQPKRGLRWLFRRRTTPLPAPAAPSRFGR